jgi:hypothetical protein
MAAIYSPWDKPEEDNNIVLASDEFMHPDTPPEPAAAMPTDMMAAAMETIQQQSQLIQQLTMQLTRGAVSE